MRSIDEIKAELSEIGTLPFLTADMIEARTKRLTKELVNAVINGIPLDQLETVCNAIRDNRCVVLPVKVGEIIHLENVNGEIKEFYVYGFDGHYFESEKGYSRMLIHERFKPGAQYNVRFERLVEDMKSAESALAAQEGEVKA